MGRESAPIPNEIRQLAIKITQPHNKTARLLLKFICGLLERGRGRVPASVQYRNNRDKTFELRPQV